MNKNLAQAGYPMYCEPLAKDIASLKKHRWGLLYLLSCLLSICSRGHSYRDSGDFDRPGDCSRVGDSVIHDLRLSQAIGCTNALIHCQLASKEDFGCMFKSRNWVDVNHYNNHRLHTICYGDRRHQHEHYCFARHANLRSQCHHRRRHSEWSSRLVSS